jgi:hypothetical protein
MSSSPRLWERGWVGPTVVACAAIAMAVWTWQTWADVLVDFGVQLYVPWRLAAGQVMYRDIAHYTGPVSIYYSALAFRVFGASLLTVELANLPVLAGIVWCIYRLAQKLGGRGCAVICGVSFVTLFAFAHLTPSGNYNFVCPYEYEYTHGTLLCLLSVMALAKIVDGGGVKFAAVAGFLCGAVFLTRAEFFVAAMGAAVAGMILLSCVGEPGKIFRACLAFLLALPAPFSVSLAWLSAAMPIGVAVRGALGMWPSLLRGDVAGQYFYRHSMGVDDLSLSLQLLGEWSAIYIVIVGGVGVWAIWASKHAFRQGFHPAVDEVRPSGVLRKLAEERERGQEGGQRSAPAHAAVAMVLAAFVMGYAYRTVDWKSVFRPLPVVMGVVIFGAAWGFYARRKDVAARGGWALAIILAVTAAALLGKVILYARIIQYGCWLAMPATMVLLIAVFGWVPRWIRARGGAVDVYFAGVGTVWAVVILVMLSVTGAQVHRLTEKVGAGADSFWADANRGARVNTAVELVRRLVPADRTVACFPEGIMINYLARRRTATAYVNFNPPDLLLFGEDRMLAALETTPPDVVLIVHKDTSEFGERFFGQDYGQKIWAWIQETYQVRDLPTLDLGAEPLQSGHFGVRLMVPRARERFTREADGVFAGNQ